MIEPSEGPGEHNLASRSRGRGTGHLEGILAIDKPPGPTSHDVVRVVRRILRQRRVGHCGTLDPAATGVLLVCVGRYTRLADLLSDGDKEYVVTIRLGAASDTYDGEGRVESWVGAEVPSLARVREAVQQFCGPLMQVPPPFSAVKVNGVRSYKRARRGEDVALRARRVVVHRIDVIEYRYPALVLGVACSKGTYIRSLAHDLGRSLGTGGYVEQLRRTRVGNVTEALAVRLEELEEAAAKGYTTVGLVPVAQALADRAQVRLEEAELQAFTQGRAVMLTTGGLRAAGTCLVMGPGGCLRGIGVVPETLDRVLPRKVIGAPAERSGQKQRE